MATTALLLRTHHACKPPPPRPAPLGRAAIVCRATASASAAQALRSLAPPPRPELFSLDLPRYDPARSRPVDLAVVGGGSAGLAVAQRVAEAGLAVVSIDPSPGLVWPNNYGVWVDEFEAMGLSDCLDTVWPSASVFIDDTTSKSLHCPYARVARRKLIEQLGLVPTKLKPTMMDRCIAHGVRFHQAKVVHNEASSLLVCDDGVAIPATVVLDATGFSRCLVQYDKPYNPGYQVAYGILAEVDGHPFDIDKMLFMDWRDSHLPEGSAIKERNSRVPTFLYAMPFSPTKIFLEETSLVARPGLAMDDIQERMAARLRHLGIHIRSVEEDERCVIPMGGPLPVLPQRVVGIGGTAGMVHPSTGYMVVRTLATAPIVADSIVRFLNSGNGGIPGDALAAEVWKELWPTDRRRQREFFCFGMDVLLKLDLQGTRRFFNAFFNLEPHYWHGFLSSRLFLPALLMFGLSLFAHASNTSKLEIMAKGTLPLARMVGNLIQDKDR